MLEAYPMPLFFWMFCFSLKENDLQLDRNNMLKKDQKPITDEVKS